MFYKVSIFRAQNGESMFLRNVGIYLQVHTALQPRRHLHRRENLKSQMFYKVTEIVS
jgi:hypothetical protein